MESQVNIQSTSQDTLQSSPEQPNGINGLFPSSQTSIGSQIPPHITKNGDHMISGPMRCQEHLSRPSTSDSRSAASGSSTFRIDTTVGQKRTASGYVKSPASATSISPDESSEITRSRRTSASSHMGTSQLAEVRYLPPDQSHRLMEAKLSAQLRTRLSYAVVKVQKGWEARKFDELESLTSQQASPVSAAAPPRKPNGSPRVNLLNAYQDRAGAFNQSSERTTIFPEQQSLPSRSHNEQAQPGRVHYSPSRSRYAHGPKSDPNKPSSAGLNAPTLAPPVDLTSRHDRHPRRSQPAPYQPGPPPLSNTRNVSNLSASSASSGGMVPATPPPRLAPPPSTTLKTPSGQKATAMEKDAIETLVFMSSPGNSQQFQHQHPHSQRGQDGNNAQNRRGQQGHGAGQKQRQGQPHLSTQTTTTRPSGQGVPERQVAFAPADGVAPISPREHEFLDGANLENSENIDRVLDQMPVDGDSSSEEEMEVEKLRGKGTVGIV